MNISDAAYKTVHDYPGGSEALAPRIGMSAAVLRNKVNPNNKTHHLAVEEASRIIGVTGDFAMLHALCAEHAHTAQRAGVPTAGSLLTALLSASAAKGKLAEIINEALRDNRITPNEAAEIDAWCSAGQAFLAEVGQHARAAAKIGEPA